MVKVIAQYNSRIPELEKQISAALSARPQDRLQWCKTLQNTLEEFRTLAREAERVVFEQPGDRPMVERYWSRIKQMKASEKRGSNSVFFVRLNMRNSMQQIVVMDRFIYKPAMDQELDIYLPCLSLSINCFLQSMPNSVFHHM